MSDIGMRNAGPVKNFKKDGGPFKKEVKGAKKQRA
jgi:hypothetical protein